MGIAGATFDIVIDAYRIELLEPRQLGVGSGMSQYGWRIGAASAGAVALVVAARYGWSVAYAACALFALPAMLTGVVMGEPARRRPPAPVPGLIGAVVAYFSPLRRVPRPARRARGADLRGDPQDRRHARQPDGASAVRGSRVHQRRGRVLRRHDGVHRLSGGNLRRRHALRVPGDEAIGVHQPGADGGVELRLRAARRLRPQQSRHGGRHVLRELRQRDRRRHGRRLSVRALQPALHGDPVRAASRRSPASPAGFSLAPRRVRSSSRWATSTSTC